MSSEVSRVAPVPVPVPHTAVPLGITDPVEKARTELKAALAAIEVKANVPRRVSRVIDDSVEKARTAIRSLSGATQRIARAARRTISQSSRKGRCRPLKLAMVASWRNLTPSCAIWRVALAFCRTIVGRRPKSTSGYSGSSTATSHI